MMPDYSGGFQKPSNNFQRPMGANPGQSARPNINHQGFGNFTPKWNNFRRFGDEVQGFNLGENRFSRLISALSNRQGFDQDWRAALPQRFDRSAYSNSPVPSPLPWPV